MTSRLFWLLFPAACATLGRWLFGAVRWLDPEGLEVVERTDTAGKDEQQ